MPEEGEETKDVSSGEVAPSAPDDGKVETSQVKFNGGTRAWLQLLVPFVSCSRAGTFCDFGYCPKAS